MIPILIHGSYNFVVGFNFLLALLIIFITLIFSIKLHSSIKKLQKDKKNENEKRKFNIYFNFLISVFLIIFLYQNSFDKDNCVKFLDDLDNNFDKYAPNDYPRFIYNDFGFDFKFEWDDLNKKWILAKDDDGYPIIGRIIDEENIGKIKRGDVVISANGKDIENMT